MGFTIYTIIAYNIIFTIKLVQYFYFILFYTALYVIHFGVRLESVLKDLLNRTEERTEKFKLETLIDSSFLSNGNPQSC